MQARCFMANMIAHLTVLKLCGSKSQHLEMTNCHSEGEEEVKGYLSYIESVDAS